MTSPKEQRPEGIPVRRPKTDLAHADVDRWIVPDDPFFSHYLAALSAVFPNGEDFFVESVRNYRDIVAEDRDLKARVKGFIGQESMHGREHRAFNQRLAELGYPTVQLDRNLLRAARLLQKLPAPVQLAVTAASEHFTSVLAEILLSDEETRRTLLPSADGELLVTWHALEELEHKDVAYDVFARVSGGYGIRLLGVGFAAAGFGTVVISGYLGALLADRRYLTRAARQRNRHNFARQQMVSRRAGRALLQYLRPGFHPRDIYTDGLVAEWRDRLSDDMTAAGGAGRQSA
ncbi:MAG: metal-dependent hydrolase [Actinomycetota bacterium]|nr:metal-dependent hydrolase [Actinomycetota bacterium]